MSVSTRDFLDALGLELPIVQAPMAGGPCPPPLIAAVAEAGALGSFGFAYTQPEAIRTQLAEARSLRKSGRGAINANLFVYEGAPPPRDEEVEAARQTLAPFYARFGLEPPALPPGPAAPSLDAQIDCLLEERPEIFTFHLGLAPRGTIEAFQGRGIKVGGSATTPGEAKALVELGVDFIVAQGAEAGGHRGTFQGPTESGLIGTLALTRMIVAEVTQGRVPVVAAGGIMDGAGLAAVLALGAAAAQLGTAFLDCAEAGTAPAHRAALRRGAESGTRLTTMFSGKPARSLANNFCETLPEGQAPRLAFPYQNSLTGALRAASGKAGDPEAMSLWAGQAASLARTLPAAGLIAQIMAEYRQARTDLPAF